MGKPVQNHPFVDGNKRVAFAATCTFLRLNGRQLVADPIATYDFMLDLYRRHDFTFARLLPWLRDHLDE
ncbi:Fic family protein [Zavarzinia compransoris]|uniref:Fic family protein n=1 Tax=Zavarzinia marina TaxID=2911065 RepID=UPI001F348E12|nr:Fic family protein [Zavarzinia marina]MCF4166862.1 Fic family protein [Zavarzinia marina]